MKDFMLIFIGGDYDQSPEEMQVEMGKWFAWDAKLREQGILKHGNALTPPQKRISGSEMTVTDGPFADAKELVGGYYVVQAANFDEAIKIAADFPGYDTGGTVEVREVMVFE